VSLLTAVLIAGAATLMLALVVVPEGFADSLEGRLALAAFWCVVLGLLLAFDGRGHRWPPWVLLVLLTTSLVRDLASVDDRAVLAVFDGVAMGFLLWGWPRPDRALN
jgi:hypothetical protein